MPLPLLLAMQAAGMVVDYLGTQNQAAIMGMGAELQQAGIETNIEQTRLEAEDASLQALKNLRKNLGTQAAIFAARGTRQGTGSALSAVTESIGNFQADERMRRMNLLGKQTALKGQSVLSKLGASGEQSKLWSGFAQRTFNKFSTNPDVYKGGNTGTSGGVFGTAISSKLNRSYGLTQMR